MMTEILTALLVVITGFYAWVTFRMLKANHRVIDLMAEQSENTMRPYITITPFVLPERPVFTIKIANTGKTAARNLKLNIDRDYYRYGRDGNRDDNIADFVAFNNVIESYSPGAEMFFDLAQTFLVFADDADENSTPALFTITAEYSYNDKIVIEKNVIDLRPYKKSNPPIDSLVSGVKEVSEKIEKSGNMLKQAIAEIPSR